MDEYLPARRRRHFTPLVSNHQPSQDQAFGSAPLLPKQHAVGVDSTSHFHPPKPLPKGQPSSSAECGWARWTSVVLREPTPFRELLFAEVEVSDRPSCDDGSAVQDYGWDESPTNQPPTQRGTPFSLTSAEAYSPCATPCIHKPFLDNHVAWGYSLAISLRQKNGQPPAQRKSARSIDRSHLTAYSLRAPRS